jgi:hypothetical protein
MINYLPSADLFLSTVSHVRSENAIASPQGMPVLIRFLRLIIQIVRLGAANNASLKTLLLGL